MGRKNETTTLAKASASQLTSEEEAEANALDALSDFFDNVAVDGMEDVEGDDLKLAVELWNMKGLNADREAYKKNEFYNTVTERTTKELDCVLLVTKKSLRWDEYDNAQEKTVVHCQSSDRKVGTMADGKQRNCKGCPDSGWHRDEEGKPYRKCGPVHTVVAVDRLTQKPFLTRMKKTALKPFRTYLMQNHWGARKGSDGRVANVPLYAYNVRVLLEMHESGNYALPVFTRGDLLDRATMKIMSENAKAYLEMIGEVEAVADAADARHATEGGRDPNLSGDDFSDDDKGEES